MNNNRVMMGVVTGALVVGLGTGYWLSRGAATGDGKPEQPIQWHATQAVPTRVPDAQDREWQERANQLDAVENKAASGASGTVQDKAA